MRWVKILGLATFLLIVLRPATGQMVTDTAKVLIVGVKEAPPFIIENSGEFRGVSIELWEKLASKLGFQYEYREVELSRIVAALETGEIDVSINPLTVTSERIKHIDFTQPYYTSHSAIAVVAGKQRPVLTFLKNLFSLRFLATILLLFLLLLLIGMIASYFERRHNPSQFRSGWKGMLDGAWWAATTMTTVGYGDKVPVSNAGRIMGILLMVTAVIAISGFTATITSLLTVNQLESKIHDLSDLRQSEVGVVAASATESYLVHNYFQMDRFPDVHSGLAALEAGKIDAFVHDEPILRYLTEHSENKDLQVLPFRFNTQYYSFGLPRGSELTSLINPLLLFETELLEWKVMLSEYGLNEF